MQTVTDEYIAAMRSGSRTDRITGTITLTDGTVIDVTDNVLVNNNLSVDEQIMRSFDIGTFYSSQMKLAIYDSEALLHEFANARIELFYGLLVGEEYEEVFLGRYTVDGTNCKRVRDRVYLTAYDRSAKFDRIKCGQIVSTAMPPYNALQLICSECSVSLATAQEEIEAMPNGTLSIKCDSSRIETMRDCVMWIAALLGGYARINREGMLEIRKAKYSVDPDDQTTIIVDRVLNSKERISTTFSDTRIYPKFMEAYCGGESKVYSSSYVSTDTQARAGSFSLPENPLVISLSAEKQDEINGNILDYLDNFKQRNIKAAIFGDPAIECGDTIKCTGGSIDVGRNIVGVVTRYTWKFRQQSTIQCVAPAAGEITAESDVSTFSVEAASEAAEGAFVMPRAQSEKRSGGSATNNAEKFTSFSANADGTYTYNGVTYGFETDEGTGYINKVYDDERTVDIDTENAAVNSGKVDFNTIVLSVAMANGLSYVPNSEKTSVYEVEITADGGQIFLMNENGTIVLEHATIDWGDGSSEEYSTRNSYLHTYEKAGTYRISITADLTTLWGGFQARSNAVLKSVIRFANCVTMLGDLPNRAYDGDFEYIRLPKRVTELHDYMFNNGSKLKQIYGLENVTKIGTGCFCYYSLQGAEIVLPKCTSIGSSSFVYTGIVKLDAPELTSIGGSALNSTNLKYLNAPKITSLNDCMAFCTTLEEAHLEGLITIDTPDLNNKTMTVHLSTALTFIRQNAFYDSNVTIEYSGTQEQWDAIEKQEYWDTGATITLHCNG